MITMRRLAALMALLASCACGATRADTIYSNLGPGDGFDPGNAYFFGGLNSTLGTFLGSGDLVAMQFAVPAGTAYAFTGVEMALVNDGGPPGLTVELAADAAGLPGAILESIPVTIPDPSPALVTATSALMPTLAAGGVYWIIAAVDTGGPIWDGWNFALFPATGTVSFNQDFGAGPTGWIPFSTGGSVGAFRVSGNPALAPTPEPSTLALAVIACLAALGYGWRKRAVTA